MKTINYGKVNDVKVFAINTHKGLIALDKEDLEFESPDYCIKYDSGSYPSISNVEQYICDQVVLNEMV